MMLLSFQKVGRLFLPLPALALLIPGCIDPFSGPPGRSGFSGDVPWLDVQDRKPIDLSGTFQTVDGRHVALTEIQDDNILFLNAWATWCAPCRQEMPSMASLYEKLSRRGLAMVAISDEPAETVRQYLQDNPYPFTVLLDPENILSQRFQIHGIPTTLVIDRERRLVLRHTGAYQWDSPETLERFQGLLRPQ